MYFTKKLEHKTFTIPFPCLSKHLYMINEPLRVSVNS